MLFTSGDPFDLQLYDFREETKRLRPVPYISKGVKKEIFVFFRYTNIHVRKRNTIGFINYLGLETVPQYQDLLEQNSLSLSGLIPSRSHYHPVCAIQ